MNHVTMESYLLIQVNNAVWSESQRNEIIELALDTFMSKTRKLKVDTNSQFLKQTLGPEQACWRPEAEEDITETESKSDKESESSSDNESSHDEDDLSELEIDAIMAVFEDEEVKELDVNIAMDIND